MQPETGGLGERLRNYVLNTLGLILLLSLPLIWVAWTQAILVGIVITGFAAGVLYCVVYAFHYQAPQQSGEDALLGAQKTLGGEFMTELTSLGPWVHHNRLQGSAAFRKKMEALQRLKMEDEKPEGY